MGFFSKFCKKKVNTTRATIAKVENRELMQGAVGGAFLAAAASGGISPEEEKTIAAILRYHPALEHFGDDITQWGSRCKDLLTSAPETGKTMIMKEILDCAGDADEAKTILSIMTDVAGQDGEVDEKEHAVIEEVGKTLRQSTDFLFH